MDYAMCAIRPDLFCSVSGEGSFLPLLKWRLCDQIQGGFFYYVCAAKTYAHIYMKFFTKDTG